MKSELDSPYYFFHRWPSPLFITDSNGVLIYINPEFERITGFKPEYLMSLDPPYPFWHGDEIADIASHNKHIGGNSLYKDLKRLRNKNGDTLWFEVTSISIPSNGNSTHFLFVCFDITENRQLELKITNLIEESRTSQEDERIRISRELHDETAQELSAVCLEISEILMKKSHPEEALNMLEAIPHKIEHIMNGIRNLCRSLRSDYLKKFGLVSAIQSLAFDFYESTHIPCEVKVLSPFERIEPNIELSVLRIIQESLNNISKHAKAKNVTTKMTKDNRMLNVNIIDNGRGFEVLESLYGMLAQGKLGLIGMSERIKSLNGKLIVSSKPDCGTKICIKIPI